MPTPSPADFQHGFGAALAGHRNLWSGDPKVARALTIFRNTSARALQDALAANYPVVRAIVGEEAFDACARAFTEAHPSSDPRLCLYGEGFAAFTATYGFFASLSYLPDIANLERLCTEALFAADAGPFDGSQLDLDRPLRLHPATRLAHFESPAVALWNAHQEGGGPLDEIVWERCTALVTRSDQVHVTMIDPITSLFVEQCRDGALLGDAAASATVAGGNLTEIFAALIVAGAFRQTEL
jgi:Putative DNA-binding domain